MIDGRWSKGTVDVLWLARSIGAAGSGHRRRDPRGRARRERSQAWPGRDRQYMIVLHTARPDRLPIDSESNLTHVDDRSINHR